jgi:sirohydrochlorin ferrochelatase
VEAKQADGKVRCLMARSSSPAIGMLNHQPVLESLRTHSRAWSRSDYRLTVHPSPNTPGSALSMPSAVISRDQPGVSLMASGISR